MEWNKQKIKGLLLVVCGGVAFYCALQRLDAVLAALGWLLGILAPFLLGGALQNLGVVVAAVLWVLGILSPFILGGAIAFVLNVPMRAIERHLFPRNQKGAKLRRPLALVLTLVAVIGVLALAGLVIGPGIADAVMSIIREIPAAFQRLEHQLTALAENLQDLWPLLEEQLMKLQEEIQWQELSAKALEIAKAIGAGIVSSGGFIGGVVSGVSTFVISLIFSFYVLLQKEKLGRQGRQVIYGLLPLRQADRTLDVLRLSGRTFSSFLSGQCLEACILGTLFVAAMTIFRMPYALLVGGELLSRITDMDDRSTCILFGDGAGAAVVKSTEGAPWHALLGTRGNREALWAAGPGNHPAYLHMNGQEVFQFALKTVPELARSLLDKAGMDRDQIDWYVLHQANHRILEGVAKRMKVPMERFYENIGRYGNTSAATIPIALDEMAEQELLRPGQWIMCLGFGAGLTWGGAMFRW